MYDMKHCVIVKSLGGHFFFESLQNAHLHTNTSTMYMDSSLYEKLNNDQYSQVSQSKLKQYFELHNVK